MMIIVRYINQNTEECKLSEVYELSSNWKEFFSLGRKEDTTTLWKEQGLWQ